MAKQWLKLEGATAELFEEQYSSMLAEHPEVSRADFPPELFVQYLLDIRKKSLEMKRINVKLPAPKKEVGDE